MTLSISKKLILAFLGLTLVVLIATLGLARWSFERGFLDYMNALEQVRLLSLADRLSEEYLAADGSWTNLTPQHFDDLLRHTSPGGPLSDGRPHRPPPPGFGPPPHGAPDLDHTPPPPGFGPPPHDEANPDLRPPPPERTSEEGEHPGPMADRFPPPPDGPERPLGPPTALFNANGQQIAGMPIFESVKFPATVPVMANGQQIGEIQTAPPRHFDSPQETAFSRQQLNSSLAIGIISLALATVVSWLLARVLLAPIHRMVSSVSQLSNGDYSTRLNERRKDELGGLMNDLDRLAHKLEENRASRRRWLADISHELRTPVSILTGEIETLKDGIRPLDMEQILSLDQEIVRLRHLINDLYELSLSDIGGLRYSFSPVNVRDNLDKEIGLVQKRAEEQGIELHLSGETHAMISADSQRLDQLFSNLVENALAYTDSPGKIEITLSNDSQGVSIRIEDTPPGINENESDKLFDPLYRQDESRSRRTAGAGLGLAICQNIVIAHQGTISASPSRLGGLCVEIHFPTLTEQ